MRKKIVNFKNIIFLLLICAFVVIIYSQQATLDQKIDGYRQASAESRRIEEKSELFAMKQDMEDTETSEEDLAREQGFIYEDEVVFQYGE